MATPSLLFKEDWQEIKKRYIYHVDGVHSLRHIDCSSELPRLKALQILLGAGKPSPLHYMDVLKKVQAAGKNLQISFEACQVEQALSELSARGLHMLTSTDKEDQTRALLKMADKWSVDRG